MSEFDPATKTCAESIVQTITAHGIKTVYGLPGVQNDWLFNAFFDAGNALSVVHTRHEQGAAYMALGAAMATGAPSLCCVVPGVGALNASAALATAYSVNAPMFFLAGQIPSHDIGKGHGHLHEIPDQLGVLRSLTKHAERAVEPTRAARQTAECFQRMMSGRRRPVALEVPPDILATRGFFSPASVLPFDRPPAPDASAVAAAAALLEKAERPMIFVGGGAIGASEFVRQIAEKMQAPVVSFRHGRGIVDDRHPLGFTYPAAHALWKECDVVLGIGSRMQAPLHAWGRDAALKIIRVDIDEEEARRICAPDVALIGDAREALAALDAALPTRRGGSRLSELAAVKAQARDRMDRLEPLASYLRAIRTTLPENGLFVEDLTQAGYFSRSAFPVYAPRTFLSTGYQGNLGAGFAIALGAKHARPDLPVVSISGDGGFMFNVQELASAVRHHIGLVAIVFNDSAYGNVRRSQIEDYGGRVIATDLANPDFVRMAESFGAKGMRARSPDELANALRSAFEADGPMIIDVSWSTPPSPWAFVHFPKVRG